ncbi:Thioredoxin-like 3-2 chloroplastic [Quillaja saponaria]|uniref:Thioredoxin-like 3-2 chloroplastic n=1 Tax=Quillaja saponaria TaxID=32244 RepID=A0AAD7VGI6_QUISA|nr:Thioredoxin-like 3-2 chloroplastic [Quillaja saponaria]
MSEALRIHLSARPLRSSIPGDFSRELSNTLTFSFRLPFSSVSSSLIYSHKFDAIGGKFSVLNALTQEGSLQELDDSPESIQLQPICSESHFDRVIAEAQQLEEAVIVVWMASWCRKCIYLKPKLEKLAAEYYPRLRFYCVDVNRVSHKLVARAGVTKMPIVQLWKDGKKQGEVIGGHKEYLVINEVREMIENE